jgi:hypothetical protein
MTDADVLTRMLHAIDRLDWATVRNCHAGDVRVDYTSLWGGEPATIAIGDLIGQWQETLKGFGATQHLTGPLSVTGDLVETHVTAHHWRASGTAWVVHGHYTAQLDGGRITGLTLHVFHASGDPDLPTIPAQRPLPRQPGAGGLQCRRRKYAFAPRAAPCPPCERLDNCHGSTVIIEARQRMGPRSTTAFLCSARSPGPRRECPV